MLRGRSDQLATQFQFRDDQRNGDQRAGGASWAGEPQGPDGTPITVATRFK
jgi:hypothetical protein